MPALDELINARYLLEPEQTVAASTYTHTNNRLRDLINPEAGDVPGGKFSTNEHWGS